MSINGRWAEPAVWCGLLVLALLLLGSEFAFSQVSLLATYALAGLGVVVIVGHGGQIVLAQGAFVALGAYAQALWVLAGCPPLLALPLAGLAGGLGGLLASLPARRLGGLYFAISTLAFALIVEETLRRWESLTHGARGLAVPAFALGSSVLSAPWAQAGFSLLLLLLAIALCSRLLRARPGRSWRAVREDEAAAQACGIDPAAVKLQAFAVGGTLSGLAGGLYAHWIGFISPEQFGLQFSFELLMLAFIGGVRRLSGAAWGALVMVSMPPLIALLRDALPGAWTRSAGLELLLFGSVMVAVMLFRPEGVLSENRHYGPERSRP